MAIAKATDCGNEDNFQKYLLESRQGEKCSFVNVGIVTMNDSIDTIASTG